MRHTKMDPKHWQKIKRILEKAIELDLKQRPAYLAETCRDDVELLREVESLLDYEDPVADQLEQSAFESVFAETTRSILGEQIDKYKLIDELGVGGMGSVYLAERVDGAFNQKVALKLIKRGMDSDAILRRFFTERQILASLQHPNIAHLIDGGTTTGGLPFFVMEYVEGVTIIEFADLHGLTIEARLKLFRRVCSAVNFAHQSLIIHRDLKPTNILVTDGGVPKLLDFGIAKLLRSDSANAITATQNFVFTPEYASPEQVRGDNLTTATDIYSLGVILYELLTGNRPYKTDSKNISEIIKAVCETEPERPSSVVSRPLVFEEARTTHSNEPGTKDSGRKTKPQALRGDLDNIILKSLRKEPERRYSSVEQFSEDIRRHLQGLPVAASKDTRVYRASKFIQRNRIGVVAAGLLILTLLGGLTATLYQANVARNERSKAERRFNDVRTLANSFIFEVNEKIDESPIKARELLVTRAIEYLDKLATEVEGDMGLQSELASAYEKIGDVQNECFASSIGDTAGALENHRKALRIREDLQLRSPDDLQTSLQIVSSYLKIADLSVTVGNMPTALENYNKAVATVESAQQKHSNDIALRRELARAYAKLGQGILRSGSISLSLQNYEKAISLVKGLSIENPDDTAFRHSISVYEQYAAYAKMEMGEVDEAAIQFTEALEIEEAIWEADGENLENRRNLSISKLWLGVAMRNQRRFVESEYHQQGALAIQQKLYEMDRSNTGHMNSLADCYLELGWTISESGNPKRSTNYFEKAIALYESVAKNDSGNLSVLRQISFTRIHLANALTGYGNTAKARQIYETALVENEAINRRDEKNSEFRHDKAVCLLRLAGQGANRTSNLTEAIRILEKLVNESPEHKKRRMDLEQARALLGYAL